MRLRYWVRRAVVSFPLWLYLVHEADTRRYDNGERVFLDYRPMILWTITFTLLWLSAEVFIKDIRASHRETRKGHQQ